MSDSVKTLSNPMDLSPPGSSVHGILQARLRRGGSHALLQGIFQTQGLNLHFLGLLHWQAGYLPLGPPGKPQFSLQYNVKGMDGIMILYIQ